MNNDSQGVKQAAVIIQKLCHHHFRILNTYPVEEVESILQGQLRSDWKIGAKSTISRPIPDFTHYLSSLIKR